MFSKFASAFREIHVDVLFRHKPTVGVVESTPTKETSMGRCDMCDKIQDLEDSYAATTKQVVLNRTYWEFIFTFNSMWKSFVSTFIKEQNNFGKSGEAKAMFLTIETLASVDKPWGVCERCASLLGIDKDRSRKWTIAYVENKSLPPDSGPANIQEVLACVTDALAFVATINKIADNEENKQVEKGSWWKFWR